MAFDPLLWLLGGEQPPANAAQAELERRALENIGKYWRGSTPQEREMGQWPVPTPNVGRRKGPQDNVMVPGLSQLPDMPPSREELAREALRKAMPQIPPNPRMDNLLRLLTPTGVPETPTTAPGVVTPLALGGQPPLPGPPVIVPPPPAPDMGLGTVAPPVVIPQIAQPEAPPPIPPVVNPPPPVEDLPLPPEAMPAPPPLSSALAALGAPGGLPVPNAMGGDGPGVGAVQRPQDGATLGSGSPPSPQDNFADIRRMFEQSMPKETPRMSREDMATMAFLGALAGMHFTPGQRLGYGLIGALPGAAQGALAAKQQDNATARKDREALQEWWRSRAQLEMGIGNQQYARGRDVTQDRFTERRLANDDKQLAAQIANNAAIRAQTAAQQAWSRQMGLAQLAMGERQFQAGLAERALDNERADRGQAIQLRGMDLVDARQRAETEATQRYRDATLEIQRKRLEAALGRGGAGGLDMDPVSVMAQVSPQLATGKLAMPPGMSLEYNGQRLAPSTLYEKIVQDIIKPGGRIDPTYVMPGGPQLAENLAQRKFAEILGQNVARMSPDKQKDALTSWMRTLARVKAGQNPNLLEE